MLPLSSHQIDQVLADSHDLWGDETSLPERQAAFHRWRDTVGGENLSMVGITDETGLVTASLKRYSFDLKSGRHPGRIHRLLGIGAVFTHPRFRQRGLASRLITSVLSQARANGYDAAILYSDIAPSFYEALGFLRAPAHEWSVASAALFPSEEPLRARLADRKDGAHLAQCWEASWPDSGWWRVRRQAATWELQRAVNSRPDDYLLFDDDGRECGYLAINVGANGVRVGEWATAASARLALLPRVWATVRTLAPAHARVMTWLRSDEEPLLPFERYERREAIPMLAPLAADFDWTKADAAATHFGIFDHI
jgi:predicted N-acetyltransferase YhbS